MLTLANEWISVEVDERQGAEIRAIRTPNGPNALAWYDWQSPTPVGRGSSYGSSEMDWLSAYRGGWQETVPNAGLDCEVDGVNLGFHGDASRTQWEIIDQGSDWCHLRTSSRLPITIERMMRLAPDRASLFVEGRVFNESNLDIDFVWGHHPAFPAVSGGKVDLPEGCLIHHDLGRGGDLVQEVTKWPNSRSINGDLVDLSEQPPEGVHRLLYLTGNTQGWAAVRQPQPYVSLALAWDATIHPFVWLWTMRGTNEFPWYGRASVFALEPQSAWPYDGLVGAIDRGQAIRVTAGSSVSNWLTFSLIPEVPSPVIGVSRDGSVQFMQKGEI